MDKKTKSLIQGYLEKSKEKLSVAKKLFDSADYDDAVSRAYYSAFHAAQALLLTEGIKAETHHGVVNLFGLRLVKTGKFDKRFGRFLSNLKDDREAGDYNIYSSIDQEIAQDSLREAEEFYLTTVQYLKKIRS